jgi:ATP-dependent phosphoenolpyruvate carboxykinase
MLENVKLNPDENGNLIPDYFDTTKTENGRVSYPIFHIDGYVSSIYSEIPHMFRIDY